MRFFLLIFTMVSIIFTINSSASSKELLIVEKIQRQENTFLFEESKINDINYIKRRIHHMAEIDQLLRKNMSMNGQSSIDQLGEKLDYQHSKELEKIVQEHGWITQDKFGKKACDEAWLITQHSPDLNFKHKVLFFLENLYPAGKVPAKHYAYLYDRITLSYTHLGIKQKFGTQAIWDPNKNKFELAPMDGTLQIVNKRRVKLGLPAY